MKSSLLLCAFAASALAQAPAAPAPRPQSTGSTTIILQGDTPPPPPGQPANPPPPAPPKAQAAPPPGEPSALPASPYAPAPDAAQPPPQDAYPPPDAAQPPPMDAPIQAQQVEPPLRPEDAPPPVEPAKPSGAALDGHLREGAFLSSPGSLTFILHHTLLLGVGGMMTQMVARGFNFDDGGARQAMLAGLLIGAGLGFGGSAWWQFNHWLDWPVTTFSMVNSVLGGMFWAGVMDLISSDKTLLTWGTVLGAELAAWLTTVIGGGEMSVSSGLLMSSGAGWFGIYTALMTAIIHFTGNGSNLKAGVDALLITPGIGAVVMALASLKFHPTTTQILRADAFGLGAGVAAMLISVLFLGTFEVATPYIMAMVGSAGAIATVSLLWEEAAERPTSLYRDPEKDRPYRNVWW